MTICEPILASNLSIQQLSPDELLERFSIKMPCPKEGSNPFRGGLPLSPHLSPRWGYPAIGNCPFCSQGFCRGFAAWQHPRLRSVLWLARQVFFCLEAVLAKNLPRRSRDKRVPPTDGLRTSKGHMSFRTSVTSFGTSLDG